MGKKAKGAGKGCTEAGFWGLNPGKKYFSRKLFQCVFPPSSFFCFLFSSCDGLQRMSFLGHFAWNQNKDLQLSPRRRGKAHARSHTRQRRGTPGESRQLAGGQKADGKTKPGTLAEGNWDTAAPLGSDFKSPCLTTDTCLGALHFTAAAWGYVFPSKHEQSCHEC